MNFKKVIMGIALPAALVLGANSCKQQEEHQVVPGINLANMDQSIAPGENFYDYATKGWREAHPLKPEYSRYGSFDVLAENNEVRLNDLFQGLLGLKAKKGSVEQKIADLYTMGLDSTRLNAEGAAPVKPYLEALESISSVKDFVVAMAKEDLYGAGGLYGVGVSADMMDSNNQVLYLGQSGLSMRNRDYYLNAEHAALREGFKNYLCTIFTLAGYENAQQMADDAYAVEMAIAVPYWSMIQQRDVAAQYNPMSTAQIAAAYPNIYFEEYCQAQGIPAQDKVIVGELSYFAGLDNILAKADPQALKHYLQAKVLGGACGRISDDFYAANFDFFSRQMAGTQEPKPRWKRAMAVPNSLLGEAVGEMYVGKYFSKKDKERMLGIVKNIQNALSQHVAALDWMSDETKAKAQEKLASFTVKVGYPDKWKDYSSLEIDPSKSYYENLRAASKWYSDDNLAELGQPVDRTKWGMTPQTVNAYYNPSTNEICFPAGILQPPFYNSDADDAVNYGAIGVVISHEMTHGFDDQGRLFDKEGNMNNWWTEADAAAFAAKTAKLVEQFNQIEILPGLFANGAATLGENIADQGGLRIAYTAMENSFNGVKPQPIDGFTAEQRFYIAYATLWGQNITDQECTRRTLTDVHSLGENRVNATVKNLETFFQAFDIKEGDKMFRAPEDRVVIW